MTRHLKKIILYFLLANMQICFSQYRKMPLDTNHYWLQQRNYFPPPPSMSYNCQYKINVRKDTVINGKTYCILQSGPAYCNVPAYSNPAIRTFLRQDTVLKRINIIWQNGGQEQILYNFNKNVGDTANLSNEGQVSTFTLQSKDSVLINDGFYHKRYFYGNTAGYVIEGVGGTAGLQSPYLISLSGVGDELVCFTRISPYSTIYHESGLGSGCPLNVGITESSPDKTEISVFPIPANEFLLVEINNGFKNPQFKLFNAAGLVIDKQNLHAGLNKIDISQLGEGFYAGCLFDNSGLRSNKKVIIKR